MQRNNQLKNILLINNFNNIEEIVAWAFFSHDKMNNNVNVVYSKPSVTNNKFPNRKQSKSPSARNGSITIRKPKIILFDSSECRINGME